MAKSHHAKELTIADLLDKLSRMKAVVFTHYQGLTVKAMTDLRRTLRAESVDFIVAKKTLLRRALAEAKIDPSVVDQLSGDVAMAFSFEDEVTPAKLLQKFSKDNPAIQFVGGFIGGQFYPAADVLALSKLPSREELLAKTVWVIKAPMTGLVNVLAGNMRGFVQILHTLSQRQPA